MTSPRAGLLRKPSFSLMDALFPAPTVLDTRWKKMARDLWLHRARSAMAIAAISVGITGAGSVLNAWSLIRRAAHEGYDASQPPSATLRFNTIDDALIAQISDRPDVSSVYVQRSFYATIRTGNGSERALITARTDFRSSTIGVIKRISGTWPVADSALAIETSSVDFAGIAAGSSATISSVGGNALTLPVSAVVRDVGVAPGWMEHIVYLFATPSTLRMLGAGDPDEIAFRTRDPHATRADIQAIAADIRKTSNANGHVLVDANVPVPGTHVHAAQIESLLLTQGAFGILALALSGLLVVNLVTAMLTGQVREIGIMKSMGASPNQIATIYLALALTLGVVATLVSVPASLFFGRAYAQLTGSMLNFDVTAYAIPSAAIAIQVLAGLLMPVIAAAFPVRRGCSIHVNEALRERGIAAEHFQLYGRVRRWFTWLPRPVLLATRNVFRRRQRTALTLVTLAAGGAMYLAALNLRESVRAAVGLMFASLHYDIAIGLGEPHQSDSLRNAVRDIDGIQLVEAWSGSRGTVASDSEHTSNTFQVVAPALPTHLLLPSIERGRWLHADSTNELVVNSVLVKDQPQMVTGAVVLLKVGNIVDRWRIVGIVSGGTIPVAYTSRQTLERRAGKPLATTLVVSTSATSAAMRLDVIGRIRDRLADRGFAISASQAVAQQQAVLEDHMLLVASFLGDLSILMIVVGGLGLASTMSLAVLERTREIGVLRAIGAPHSTINAMIQTEGLFISVLSWIMAIPLSVPVSLALGTAFSRVMIPVPLRFIPPATALLLWLLLVAGLAIVSCAWPAWRAMRIPAARAIAYE